MASLSSGALLESISPLKVSILTPFFYFRPLIESHSAMHALRIPTTRSLALISLPSLPVARERTETAAIVTRVAESFIRIGSFQALNPPPRESQFVFFGGGGSQAQQDPDYEALRKLGEWVSRCVLKLELKEGEAWGKKLVWECARRNAVMVAGWQQMGFMVCIRGR